MMRGVQMEEDKQRKEDEVSFLNRNDAVIPFTHAWNDDSDRESKDQLVEIFRSTEAAAASSASGGREEPK